MSQALKITVLTFFLIIGLNVSKIAMNEVIKHACKMKVDYFNDGNPLICRTGKIDEPLDRVISLKTYELINDQQVANKSTGEIIDLKFCAKKESK